MIQAAEAQFWKSLNLFLVSVELSYSAVKNKYFKQYCCSFYGSTLWSLHANKCSKICIAWRKTLKVIWNLLMQLQLLADVLFHYRAGVIITRWCQTGSCNLSL